MTHRSHISLTVALLLCSAAAPARAQTGDVATGTVVGVTATEVFIDIGADKGARADDKVTITTSDVTLTVEIASVWADGARCLLGARARYPRRGDRVTVALPQARAPDKGSAPHLIPAPDPPGVVDARWRGVDMQRKKLVSYEDSQERTRRRTAHQEPSVHGLLSAEAVALWNPLSSLALYNQLALRSELTITGLSGPWQSQLDYAHRLRLRYDLASDIGARRFSPSRSLARVYRMRAGFTLGQLRAELGRTGASPVPDAGMVDGVSVRHGVGGGVDVGAWAGARPRIDDLRPQITSLGFGVYGALRRSLAPAGERELAIDAGLLGSTYDGKLDRRALAASASVTEPNRWIYSQLVLDMNAPTRPTIEPTSVYVDAGARVARGVRASVRVDHVRSLRTAEALAVLPPGYLSTVAFSSIRAGANWRIRRGLYIDGRAGWRRQAEGASSLWSSASVRASDIWFGNDHGSLAIDGSFGHYIDGAGFRTRYSMPLLHDLDIAVGYRLHGYRYGSENARLWMHQPSLSVEGVLPASLYGSLDIDGYLGSEQLGIGALATLTRRF